MCIRDSRINTSIFADDLSEYQAYFYNAKIVVTAVIVLICLFAFVNLLNTCLLYTSHLMGNIRYKGL